jgi:serine/threonine-protein kinase
MAEIFERLRTGLERRYRIESELGSGGMALVYLAEDLKHRRQVAVKVLRPDIAASLGAERFLREIQIAAQLNHPHILALYDSGEADGFLYYVMPYVAGESLRDWLNREKQLPLDEAIDIAREVADALDYAHRQDVIHRDIKPENILLQEHHAVVADFGIARAVSVAASEELTQTGFAVGTPTYMSLEQAAGERHVDGRSDIYSLGCVLYEMLGGDPPFTGSTPKAILARKTVEQVPSLRLVRETVPESLELVVLKSLAKAPADRYGTAGEFAAALAAPGMTVVTPAKVRAPKRHRVAVWSVAAIVVTVVGVTLWQKWSPAEAPVGLDPNVIAVLPFRVTASDSSYNYLREGIVDLLNARLTGEGVPRAVDSRTTLSRWRRAVRNAGGELPAGASVELASRLGAGRVLLGELVVTPSGAEISGRLLGVPSGEILVEHSESGTVNELVLVDRFVVGMLGLAAGEGAERVSAMSESLPAVKAYLAGLQAYRGGEYTTAAEHLERALDNDSTFALAALRLTQVSNYILSVPFMRDASQIAWSLRDRLDARDQALLQADWGIGPNYPEPSTTAERIRALEYAAHAAPDRAEAWGAWGIELEIRGAQASIEDWVQRAAFVLDSAIALDSTFADVLRARLGVAMATGDSTQIRKFADLYFAAAPAGDRAGLYRWQAAHALNDSVALSAIRLSFSSLSDFTVAWMDNIGVAAGLPLDDAEQATELRLADPAASSASHTAARLSQFQIAAARGRVRRAIAVADSLLDVIDPGLVSTLLIGHALIEAGYDAAASRAAQWLGAHADTTEDADPICWVELWRVSRGDTTNTRRAVDRLRRVVRKLDPGNFPRVGRLGVCPLLLEAMVESMRSRPDGSPALERLDSLMTQGTGYELPGNVANLMIARWREMQGDYARGLAAHRRHRVGVHPLFSYVTPAHLREEGRLAALVGDTVGAIRAYDHYLTIRDDPDAVMQPQVDSVRAELAALVGEPRAGEVRLP